jgi:hypothetical protein
MEAALDAYVDGSGAQSRSLITLNWAWAFAGVAVVVAGYCAHARRVLAPHNQRLVMVSPRMSPASASPSVGTSAAASSSPKLKLPGGASPRLEEPSAVPFKLDM